MSTAIDLSVQRQGSLEGLVELCFLNGLDINSEGLPAGDRYRFPEMPPGNGAYEESRSPYFVSATYLVEVGKMQDLFDLCLQETGSLEGLLALMQQAGIEDVNAVPATPLLCSKSNVYDRSTLKVLRSKRARIATNMVVPGTDAGIGFWGIEFDFTVQ